MSATLEDRAVWSASYINGLPDSSFLYIEPGGSKDGENKTTPRSLRHFPVKDANGKVDLPHVRNALSRIPQANIPATAKASATAKAQSMLNAGRTEEIPKENLTRGLIPAEFELRDEGDGGMPTLAGEFAVFDQWTEINSLFEGHFMERFAPGAFTKTIQENRDNMRVLFQHGQDPSIGDKPLGMITELHETDRGAYYEVPLFDTSYNRDLIPGLEAGAYGASFRFRVVKQEIVDRPERSDTNPDGVPERTISEAKVKEFGPVTFPAYAGATAGLRSLTDDFVIGHVIDRLGGDPEKLRALLDAAVEPEPSGVTTPSEQETKEEPEQPAATTPTSKSRFESEEGWETWLQWNSLRS